MNIFEEENGNVLNFTVQLKLFHGNPVFQLEGFRLVQFYPFNILTVQKEISAVSLVSFLWDRWCEFGSFFQEDLVSMKTKTTNLF